MLYNILSWGWNIKYFSFTKLLSLQQGAAGSYCCWDDWHWVLLVWLVFTDKYSCPTDVSFFLGFFPQYSRNYHTDTVQYLFSWSYINIKTISISLLRLACLHKINCFIYHVKSYPGHWRVPLQSGPFFFFFAFWTCLVRSHPANNDPKFEQLNLKWLNIARS